MKNIVRKSLCASATIERLCPSRMISAWNFDLKTDVVRLAAWANLHSGHRTLRFPAPTKLAQAPDIPPSFNLSDWVELRVKQFRCAPSA
jgi:hypothetical protein